MTAPGTPGPRVLSPKDLRGRHRDPRAWWLVLRGGVYGAGILISYYLLPLDRDIEDRIWVRLTIGLVVLSAVLVWQVYAVATTDHPQLQALTALTLSVPLLLVLFSTAYIAFSNSDPQAFTEPLGHTSSLYFSLTTLTTVGFGDIAARSDAARIIVMVQMVADVIVIAVTGKVLFGMARTRAQPVA